METGRKDEDEGADALPFLFLNCGFEDEKEDAWRNTGSWRFIPTHDKGTARDTLTVEHSGAPVTNDSYTEEDEFKAVGADMRINGVDAIYKECTFEPIYQKDPDLYANASAVYKNVIEKQNKDILSGLHEEEQVPFKSDLQLGAQVNRKFSDAVYDSVICLNTYNGAEGAPGEEVDASRENPISYTPYSSVGDTKSPTVISKCPETVNRDMIEFLLSVIRPIGAISRYKTDSVTNTTVQSIFHPMDIDVINVVLRDILYGLGLNKKQYRGICDVKKSLYERLELCENLNITKLLDKKINDSINTAFNVAYNEMPVGNTITIPRAHLYKVQGYNEDIKLNVLFSYDERCGWLNEIIKNTGEWNIQFNPVNAINSGIAEPKRNIGTIFGTYYDELFEYTTDYKPWKDLSKDEKWQIGLTETDQNPEKGNKIDEVWYKFFNEINKYSNNKMCQANIVSKREIIHGEKISNADDDVYMIELFGSTWISTEKYDMLKPSDTIGEVSILNMKPVSFYKVR
jgi:hypothetical protein